MPACVGQFPQIAWSGDRLVAAGFECLMIFDSSGAAIRKISSPFKDDKSAHPQPYIVNGGRDLLLFDGKHKTLHRYEMPL
jgi:hypothetical protein